MVHKKVTKVGLLEDLLSVLSNVRCIALTEHVGLCQIQVVTHYANLSLTAIVREKLFLNQFCFLIIYIDICLPLRRFGN